ncbi:hypothetical protein CR513_08430, partial [Mucuna pruriens]
MKNRKTQQQHNTPTLFSPEQRTEDEEETRKNCVIEEGTTWVHTESLSLLQIPEPMNNNSFQTNEGQRDLHLWFSTLDLKNLLNLSNPRNRITSIELFGFKNQFIQRLLREQVTNVNGKAERSLVSPNVCDGVTRTDNDDCCPNVGAYPDLVHCLAKPRVTGKRSRCELKNKKYNVRARSQSLEFTCSRSSNVKNEKSLGQGSSTTHYGSEVHEVHNQVGVSAPLQRMSSVGKSIAIDPIEISYDKKVGAVPSKGQTGFLYSKNCKTTEPTGNLRKHLNFLQLHRSHDVELKISNLMVTLEDKKLMQSCCEESVGCIDIDLCAPDTLDFVQENTPDSAASELDKNAYNETGCEITSRDLLNAEHEVFKSNSNPSSEKSDFGSTGQDVAKSMMSFLLPQAVPLLRNVSTDKEFTISPSNMLPSQVNSKDEQNKIGYSLDVHCNNDRGCTWGKGEKGKRYMGIQTHIQILLILNIQSLLFPTILNIVYVMIIRPIRKSYLLILLKLLLGHDLPNGTSTCHALGLDFKDRSQNCDVCIPESVLDVMSPKDLIISEKNEDACSDFK